MVDVASFYADDCDALVAAALACPVCLEGDVEWTLDAIPTIRARVARAVTADTDAASTSRAISCCGWWSPRSDRADGDVPVIQPRPHIEALEVFVDVLSRLDEESAPDELYNRLCEVICRLGSMERAVLFRYEGARRRVRAAGAHGLDIAEFSDAYITVESAPMAGRALALDQVVEVAGDFERELASPWAERLEGRHLACTPMAAGGRWVGVVVSDHAHGSPPLTHEERDALWTLGRSLRSLPGRG